MAGGAGLTQGWQRPAGEAAPTAAAAAASAAACCRVRCWRGHRSAGSPASGPPRRGLRRNATAAPAGRWRSRRRGRASPGWRGGRGHWPSFSRCQPSSDSSGWAISLGTPARHGALLCRGAGGRRRDCSGTTQRRAEHRTGPQQRGVARPDRERISSRREGRSGWRRIKNGT